MRIFKYQLYLTEYQKIELPKGANVLTVQSQFGQLTMWAEVLDISETEMITLNIIGTGQTYEYDVKRKYISTVQMGEYIWHVFQILN